MVFEQLAQAVLGFVNWGITIVVIMLIWEVIQFIRGGTDDRSEGSSGIGKKSLGEIKEGFNKWTGRDEVEKKKKITRDASRQETAELNEYIEEKNELELLDEAVTKSQEFLQLVGEAQKSPTKALTPLTSKIKELNKAVTDAGNETNKLKRNTWRERSKMKNLLKSLSDAEVSKGDLDKIRALEDQVLKRHDYVITNLTSAAAALRRGNSALTNASKNIKNRATYLTNLQELFYKEVIPLLQNAKGGQESAYKDTEDLISRIRKVWK